MRPRGTGGLFLLMGPNKDFTNILLTIYTLIILLFRLPSDPKRRKDDSHDEVPFTFEMSRIVVSSSIK